MISQCASDTVDGERSFNYLNKGELFDDDVENVEVEKVEKGRERNREHAKRTRLRKKAVLEGMKGKLMELQNEASKLQQSFEERNTANILLCLCSKALPDAPRDESAPYDTMKVEPGFDPSVKGNIIQQLRTKVRSEAAQKHQEHVALARSRTNSISIPDPPTSSSSFSAYTDAVHVDTDCDSDNDDDDAFQPLPKSIVNWKNGTVVSEEGGERKLSDEEMEHLRKERNRVHAKLTRDRKKLFTSRMQQMINSLERQNLMMKSRLKSLVGAGELSGPMDRNHNPDQDQHLIAKLQEFPRQNLGLGPGQFHSKFPAGFSASLLQVLNTNNSDNKDQRVADSRPSSILGFHNPSSNQHNSEQKEFNTKPFIYTDRSTRVQNDANPFLGTLGPLSSRASQNDANPFLGTLGPLSSRASQNDANPFLGTLGPLSSRASQNDANPFLGTLGPLSSRASQNDANPFLGTLGPLSSRASQNDANPFLGTLGPLSSRASQNDANPFLGTLGPLSSRASQNDANPFLGTLGPLNRASQKFSTDCPSSHFSSSPSYFEAL